MHGVLAVACRYGRCAASSMVACGQLPCSSRRVIVPSGLCVVDRLVVATWGMECAPAAVHVHMCTGCFQHSHSRVLATAHTARDCAACVLGVCRVVNLLGGVLQAVATHICVLGSTAEIPGG